MWARKARRKHSYLHKICGDIEPCSLNRNMSRTLNQPIVDTLDMNPPFLVPTSLQPMCFAPLVDETHAFVAFGRLGIPKLIHDIHNDIPYVRSCAVTSLNDELRDPKKCYMAINLNIVKRLENYLQQLLTDEIQDLYQIDRICINLGIIATILEGAQKIINADLLVNKLYNLIETTIQAVIVLEFMASHPKIAQDMVDKNHLNKIKNFLCKDNSPNIIYKLLGYLLERSPEKGLQEGYFELLLPKLKDKNDIQAMVLRCFAIVIQCSEGQVKCDHVDIILTLYEILKTDDVDTLVHVYAAMALHNCTYSKRSRWRCREIWDLPLVLIKRAHSKKSEELQMHSLQVLRQITEMPSVKNFVRKCCKKSIKNICCDSDIIQTHKFDLLEWLRYKNYGHNETNEEIEKKDDEKLL